MGDAAAPVLTASEPLALPRALGRRILLKLVARGGMGDVYLGATTGIEGAERPCIVKTVRRDHIHDGSFLARFLDEARVQAQLQHPGVAQVLEAANDEAGEPFTVVEYVEGRALSDVRQRAIQCGVRVEWADAVAIAIEIAQALAHVHERPGPDGAPLGIVHRDLSPQNVMVGYAGEVKLIDFGTARGHNRRCHTVAGVVFAKPGYVAPEVARQQVGDGRIDLYALGIMLWELCAGRRFLTSDPQRHLDDAAAGKVIVPPVAEACGAPASLDAVISKLTMNDPDDRYARASLAVPDLGRLLGAAKDAPGSERGVRARVALLMRSLWPGEPARSRSEFARLLRDARATLRGAEANQTPDAGPVSGVMAQATATDDPSRLLGTPYRLVKQIGEGASGTVWEAEHLELARRVALKVLAPEHGSAVALERFRKEAQAVARLSHPNLVQILDFGRSLDGRAYLAMELLVGETLDVSLRDGPLRWPEAVRIATGAARALAAAHAAGLVHRDIKPQNLLITRAGEVKLLDFGIATALTQTPERKASSAEKALHGFAIFGTPEYMAPEQVSGDPVDGRADVYALGCVLYEMLTGVRAFDGPSSVAVLGKQLRDTPTPPRVQASTRGIPVALDGVVMRAMKKRPADRFVSAEAMRLALEGIATAGVRRRGKLLRAARAAAVVVAMGAAAFGSARWARTHANALDAWMPPPKIDDALASAPQLGIPESAPVPAPAPAPAPEPAHAPAPASPPEPTRGATLPLRDARALARARPSDPSSLAAWARAAFRAGELREARRAVTAWTLRDGTVEPRLLEADVLDASGKRADARAVLQGWLESHPDATAARAELARLSGEGAPREIARR